MNNKIIKYYSKYFIVIMVIKIYTLYFYQSSILIGRRPETVLIDYFNVLFSKKNYKKIIKKLLKILHHNTSGKHCSFFCKYLLNNYIFYLF